MKFKGLLVDPESKVEPIASLRVPHVEVLSWGVFIQMSVVLSKFFLGIDILQHLCGFPPLWICLNHYGFWFYFLNEFLCSLCKHCWHVTTSNKENFFATESLGEMNESAFEAIDSKQIKRWLRKFCNVNTYLSPLLWAFGVAAELADLTKTCLGIVVALSGRCIAA